MFGPQPQPAPRLSCGSIFLLAALTAGQASGGKPNIRINYLNVCTPAAEEQSEIKAALNRIPLHPRFATDFEIARGRSTLTGAELKVEGGAQQDAAGPANWVRMRRDFPAASPYASVQYSMSVDEKAVSENLVLRARQAQGVMQTALEDAVTASPTAPRQALDSDTPVTRIRLERFGKSSIVLARCAGAQQSQYEPLFAQASAVMAAYRQALAVRKTVAADLRRLGVGAPPKPAKKP